MSVRVADYYSGKSVFVTGATGFMGKVLVEKLLWSCPGLAAIYVLMRSKRQKNPKERLAEYLNDRVFERLQGNQDTLKKVKMIPGDVVLEGMGISEQDRQEIQRECHIVFHCAATVRFDMFLRDSVDVNICGTIKALKLAEGMKNLEVFVHVSTTFCHDDVEVLEEKIYPSRHNVHDILHCMKWMDDDMIRSLEPELIKPLPNTYAFSKCLAEDVVMEYKGKFPIAIARPSIVVAALREPMPGWIDNINGPTGMIYAAGSGVLRTVYCLDDIKTEAVPVDLAVNSFILLAYVTGLDKPKEINVCNYSQSGVKAFPWKDLGRMWIGLIDKYPLSRCLWYPNVTPTSSRLVYNAEVLLTQFLPACFLDMLLFLLGQKTFMLRTYHKVKYGIHQIQYYMLREWKFKNDYHVALRKRICPDDNEMFCTDMSTLNVINYMENYVKGVRQYYCKEDPSTLPKARSLHRKLYIVHMVCRVFLVCLCLYILYVFYCK